MRRWLAVGTVLGILAAAGCTRGDGGAVAACAAVRGYGSFGGATVVIHGSIRDREADLLADAWRSFAACVGIVIEYEGSVAFETRLQARVDDGDAPDLAFVPRPGLIERLARAGRLRPAPARVRDLARRNWSAEWLDYGSVEGTLYGASLGSNVKSLVWYSPGFFADRGYRVPVTYADLMALTDRIARDGVRPWCAGIESGDATGWPATDWIEEIMLREAGPATYDRWVRHEIPFDDPAVVRAADAAGAILRDERYVNGGHGGVRSIATTSFQEAGVPVTRHTCAMHRQGSFYSAQWPGGTRIGPTGDVYAFHLPGRSGASKPALGGGEFTVAFTDRPEVQAVQAYLASADFADARLRLGDWVTANRGADLELAANPVDRLATGLLQDTGTVFRFDGSDLMPVAVSAGTFSPAMVDWINGADTREVLAAVERSWPE
jgi:alpha-glucoside transport system substrate-binding protein